MSTLDASISDAQRSELIESLLAKLNEKYVFPEVAGDMEQSIRRRLSSREYDGMSTGESLARTLTEHLQEVSHDKHLRVFYQRELPPQSEERDDEARREEYREWTRAHNFGFEKVERLPGNIGYLDLRVFDDPRLGGETAVAAMNFLANADALVVDLRQNGGGSPEMIALITSYLFDDTTHLNSLYWRESDTTQQFWTLPYVPGKRFGGQKPVWVLTSSFTFSGAEEFAYNLKNLQRATIVGEVTHGGAHPGDTFRLDEHFAVFIPTGRAINPISGTNWEGTGVTPDVEVPADRALKTAQSQALCKIVEDIGDSPTGARKSLLEEARTALAELQW